MGYAHRCLAGCGRTITWSFAICSHCEGIYGSSSLQWPGWLRFLWNSTQQERRYVKRQSKFELVTDFSDTGDYYDDL